MDMPHNTLTHAHRNKGKNVKKKKKSEFGDDMGERKQDHTLIRKEETKNDITVYLEMKGKSSQNYFESRCHKFQFINTNTQHQNKRNTKRNETCTEYYIQLFVVTTTTLCGEEKGLVAMFEFLNCLIYCLYLPLKREEEREQFQFLSNFQTTNSSTKI